MFLFLQRIRFVVILLALWVSEYLFFLYLGNLVTLAITLGSICLLLFIIAWQLNNKLGLIGIIRSFRGDAGSLFGFLLVLHVFIHTGWAGNQFFFNLKDKTYSIEEWIYLEYLILPFLIVSLFNHKRHPRNQRTHLIAGPGLILGLKDCTREALTNLINSSNPREKIDSTHWGKWNVIRQSLTKHPDIKSVFLVCSHEVLQFFEDVNKIEDDELRDIFDLQHRIKKEFGNQIDVTLSPGIDVSSFESVFENKALKKYIDACDSSQLVFNLTSSTSMVTLALGLHAVKENRMAEYVRQDSGELEEVSIDVFTLKEHWNEILESMEK